MVADQILALKICLVIRYPIFIIAVLIIEGYFVIKREKKRNIGFYHIHSWTNDNDTILKNEIIARIVDLVICIAIGHHNANCPRDECCGNR